MSSSSEEICVIGAGGHANVIISAARAVGYKVVGLYDDDPTKHGSMLGGVPIFGSISNLASGIGRKCVIGIGKNRTRQQVALALSRLDWLAVVHPKAYVHESARLGPGTVVLSIVRTSTYMNSMVSGPSYPAG